MSRLDDLLQYLDVLLKKHNPINHYRLQPPLPEIETKRYLDKIGIADKSIFSLYKWKNGVADIEMRAMIFAWQSYPNSLRNVELIKKGNVIKSKKMVLIFDSPYGQSLLFNINPGKNYGKIHLYSTSLLSINKPHSYYDSFESMIYTTIKLYEARALFYDEKKDFLQQDSEMIREISKANNPNSNYWKL